jgi:hypothetical protein
MFVPPFSALVAALQLQQVNLDQGARVEVPANFLKFLLQCLLTSADFDSAAYMNANPEIKGSMEEASSKEAQLHFIRHGYFEGRRGGSPMFDESYYLERYPDVAKALEAGIANSASDHYYEFGGIEWRAPNRDVEVDIEVWREVLEGNSEAQAAPE